MENYNPFSLKDKTILITGASSGIGRASAIECSRMGAQVIVCGRDESRLAETMASLSGSGHCCIAGDLVQPEAIQAIVSQVPIVDGVLFSAGRSHTDPFLFSTREKLDTVFDINFFSPVELMRCLLKKKKIKKGGSTVFLLSIDGPVTHTPANSIYAASKAALHSMVISCARELKAKKIRVNGICPGMINTPMTLSKAFTDEQVNTHMSQYLYGRYGEPEEVAYAAVYLLSDATAWMTGQSIILDGGISMR